MAAVSEVIGVVILLAGVVSILSGAVALMQPYVQDITDNKDWSKARAAADQVNERILVAAQQPVGSGHVMTVSLGATSLAPANGAETWRVAADLAGADRVIITINTLWQLDLWSLNGSVANVSIAIGDNVTDWVPGADSGPHTYNSSTAFSSGTLIITVYDSGGLIIHRLVQVSLDGLRFQTGLANGIYEVDLVNGARMEKLPDGLWMLGSEPRLRLDEGLDGTPRVTLLLLDLDAVGRLPQNGVGTLEFTTVQQDVLIDGQGRNLRLEVENHVDDTITPRYKEHWIGDYELYLASGQGSSYEGLGPYGSVSGLEGITLLPQSRPFEIRVLLQGLEVTS